MVELLSHRPTVRRLFLATFWFAAAFGSWRLFASLLAMDAPLEAWQAGIGLTSLIGGVALFGAGIGALFGRSVWGAAVVVVIIFNALCLLSPLIYWLLQDVN